MAEEKKIYEAISNVMAEIGAIGKGKRNNTQGFMYRGIDDVMNALQPALVKHKVFITPIVVKEKREERPSKKGGILFYTRLDVLYRFYTTDGSFVDTKVIGEAMDSGDKATNKAMSIAYKYACFQVFCIPTEEMIDPDAEVHEVSGQKDSKPKKDKDIKKKTPDKMSEEEMKKEQKRIAKQKIDKTKITVIKKEIARTGINEKAICDRYKVHNLEDITEEIFPKVVNALENTKSKEAK